MYTDHYHLTGRPFQLSPDHRFFFGSRSHRKAMAYLTFGLSEREGFIVITGNIGTGKTTLVGHLMSQIDRSQYVSANVVTTQLDADDALRMVASAFGIPIRDRDKAVTLREIEAFLAGNHQSGKHVLLVVDEAQNMSLPALEELRMLSNLQLDGKPLIQCFLLGQPQFRATMAHPEMEQLRQRVIASCHLEPLDAEETRSYIEHRLRTVGWSDDPGFSDEAFRLIHTHSGGVPRRINTLCGRLLLFGYLEDLHHFDADTVTEVVEELAEEGTQISFAGGTPTASSGPPAPALGAFSGWSEPETHADALGALDRRVRRLRRVG